MKDSTAVPARGSREEAFLRGLAEDFAALRRDEVAWAEELAERGAWDVTLSDDLDPDERCVVLTR